MKLIAHRGLWYNTNFEKNSADSMKLAIKHGFGIETDLRDKNKEIVISHDPPKYFDHNLNFFDFINEIETKTDVDITFALNIKSDGIIKNINDFLITKKIKYFIFDMSIPELKLAKENNIPFLTRLSEIEKEAILLEDSEGIWLDSFYNDWYEMKLIQDMLNMKKKVFIVSPELHKRDYKELWNKLKIFNSSNDVYLCTDFPIEASIFFNE